MVDEEPPTGKDKTPKKEGEETVEDPRTLARSLLLERKPMEIIREKTGLPDDVIYGIKGALVKSGELREEEEGVEPGPGVVKPPEVETIEQAISFIESRLKKVYGVGQAASVAISGLRDDPTPLRDATVLHSFIKSLAPRTNDNQLSVMVIRPLYAKFPGLPLSVDRVLQSMQPYQPPTYWGWGRPVQPGQPQTYGYQPPGTQYPPGSYVPTFPFQSPYGYGYPPNYPIYPPAGGRTPPKTYKVVVDGQEIETDESGLRAWNEYIKKRESEASEETRRQEEHELRMKKLEEEITAIGPKDETKVPVKIGEKEVEVPASLAHLYLEKGESKDVKELREKLDDEREERHKADIEHLREDVKNRPTLAEQVEYVKTMAPYFGFHSGGRTTLDIVDSLRGDVHATADKILSKMPGVGEEFSPEVRRTPEERRKLAQQLQTGLDTTKEILEAENELIRAASQVK